MMSRTIILLLACVGHCAIVESHVPFAFADKVGASTRPMKNPKRKLKGRKLSETIFAWQQFESNWTRKKQHTSDDQKACEHMRDKHGITCAPSQEPSAAPSVAPSVSAAPSISPQPSLAPSESPTKAPTRTPSHSPTGEPSETPTNAPSGVPSVPPTNLPTTLSPTVTPFASLVLTREDGTVWQDNTCQTSLPATASQPQTEATQFEYFLFVKPESDADTGMQQVEQALATSLAERVLTCVFSGGDATTDEAPFEIFAVSSLPADERNTVSCPEDVRATVEGADCHRITAGFTPTIFYMEPPQRRRTRLLGFHRSYSTQSESEIVQYFGPVLQELLDSDRFVTGDVVATQYSGFLVGDTSSSSGSDPTSPGSGTGSDSTTTVAIQGDSATNGSGGKNNENPGYVIGAIAVCLAAVALLVVAAVVWQRRKDAARQRDFERCDDSGVDLDYEVEVDTDGEKHETGNLQEGHPGDDTRYIHDSSNNNDNIAAALPTEQQTQDFDNESLQTRSIASGNYTQSSLEARRAVRGLKYSVVDDEVTYDESLLDLDSSAGNDPHDYTNCKSETCFKCRSRNLPQPTFLKADLKAIQTDLGSNKKYTPRYDRQYAADDTVDL